MQISETRTDFRVLPDPQLISEARTDFSLAVHTIFYEFSSSVMKAETLKAESSRPPGCRLGRPSRFRRRLAPRSQTWSVRLRHDRAGRASPSCALQRGGTKSSPSPCSFWATACRQSHTRDGCATPKCCTTRMQFVKQLNY